ncbi:MAG: C39 family peptidase, partial [Planctomycetota bacterium]
RVVVAAWPKGKRDSERAGVPHPAWGKVLEVVERSQRVEDPKIAGRICSATSLGMVLAFHGFDKKTTEVCAEVHDRKAEIYGNWALNVAYAGRLGLDAAVTRMGSFEPLEAEIAAGRPVVITHRWAAGELTGSPVSATDGHLIVVRGFTKEGDLVVNDPAADPRKEQKIQRVYKRAEIEKTWLGNADGVAYLLAKRAK